MTHTTSPARRRESTSMLQWIFSRNCAVLTCELDADPRGGFEVSVIPHWNVSSAAIEHFDGARDAFRRHAELARYLRETGWHLENRRQRHAVRAA